MRLERIGKRFSDSGMYVHLEEALSGTWRARLRAEARTRFMAWYGWWSQWTCRQVGFAPSLCSIHAHVMACRRSLLAPLGRLRRSALLVSMSWTPRSDGVSCPVPVVLSSFCRQSFSLSCGSVGVSLLWETSFEVERNPFRSAEFHPAGVEIG